VAATFVFKEHYFVLCFRGNIICPRQADYGDIQVVEESGQLVGQIRGKKLDADSGVFYGGQSNPVLVGEQGLAVIFLVE